MMKVDVVDRVESSTSRVESYALGKSMWYQSLTSWNYGLLIFPLQAAYVTPCFFLASTMSNWQ